MTFEKFEKQLEILYDTGPNNSECSDMVVSRQDWPCLWDFPTHEMIWIGNGTAQWKEQIIYPDTSSNILKEGAYKRIYFSLSHKIQTIIVVK